MMNNLKELSTSVLFENNYKVVSDSIHAMHDLYASYTGIEARDITDDNIHLPSGIAVSPINAAHCLMDTKRTVVFLRGIYKTLLQLKKDFPGEKINILYAGCGPYATLLTPFTTIFSEEELGFYLMDISQVSLDAVQKLYTSLGLNNYINELIYADATTYRLPADKTMHLVISETMQNALSKESQVAVMLNLIPQMTEKTLFIPEKISVGLQLLSWEEEEKGLLEGYIPERIPVTELYTIGREQCREHEPLIVQIPMQTGKFNAMYFYTHITVFKDEQLYGNHSGLTMPRRICSIKDKGGKKMIFRYEHTSTPGFQYDWVD